LTFWTLSIVQFFLLKQRFGDWIQSPSSTQNPVSETLFLMKNWMDNVQKVNYCGSFGIQSLETKILEFADGGKTCPVKEFRNCKRTYFCQNDEVPRSYTLRGIIYVYNIHELPLALVRAEWSASHYSHFPPTEDLPSRVGGT
jgi:hypothetical protein